MELAATSAEPSALRAPIPFPAASSQTAGFASVETITEGALATAPKASAATPTVESLRHAIGCALVDGGHSSAAQLLGAGTWTLEATSLRIDVAGMGKKMLALTVNAAAEKIIRQELQRLGAPTRFLIVPGSGAAQATGPMPVPLAGSVQEAALANPLVQRAKEIFNAEVRSVVDLRIR
jgi:DNA polymerase-3 subunit gamma/tau